MTRYQREARAGNLDAAWAEVEAALPAGWTLLIGQADGGWWATASEPRDQATGWYRIVSTTTGRPVDATPVDALRALAAALKAKS